MTIVVTGAAGFIGYHVSKALLERGESVVGIDNVNDYYDVSLKRARLAELAKSANFAFHEQDIANANGIASLFRSFRRTRSVVHLAAQAGVRYSIEHPITYAHSNLVGHISILEAARRLEGIDHFVYASSTSVYGANSKLPFSVEDRVDRPISLYGATKRADELLSHSYAEIHHLPVTGLRFFTVYGPWGRPDMAAYIFAEAILAGRPIRVFNRGNMRRDFTYIDDIVAGVLAAIERRPAADARGVRHALYNLGHGKTEDLMRFIALIEESLGRNATLIEEPMQAGDVEATFADIASSRRDLGYSPDIPIEIGIPRFIDWLKAYKGGRLQ
jgi:UDP-glucuronate 4-epimerase